MALCSCALITTEIEGVKHFVITKRKTKDKGTFNEMWVCPGGHVDLKAGKAESLRDAADRECREELEYSVEIAAEPLGTYQAALWGRNRSYFIVFYEGMAPYNEFFDTEEVEAVCFVPCQVVLDGLLRPSSYSSISVDEQRARAESYPKLKGAALSQDGSSIVPCSFSLLEIVGDGGEGAGKGGLGMGHRFALECWHRKATNKHK